MPVIQKAAVIGAGTMGRGIAQWLAQVGVEVYLSDVREDTARASREAIGERWNKLVERKIFDGEQILTFQSRLHVGVEKETPWNELDLVIEAVVEHLKVKSELLQSLPLNKNSDCIVASNTSSIPIDRLAESLPSSQRARFLGLHFFNPAPVMKLVEVVAGSESNWEMCKSMSEWFREKKKVPALCKDRPGFIVNRVARNFYGEALRIVGEGEEESLREVDKVIKAVGGFPMGPFELMDLIGVDVNYHVTCSLWKAFECHPRFEPHSLQKKLVEQGRWGKKTGGGFYS